MVPKVLNIFLRVASLAAKLILTLYMGRYLGLAEMGVYGIVFGAVMITCVVLGGRLDYVVAREIVGAKDSTALRLMRDQFLFYVLHYVVFGAIMLAVYAAGVASAKLLLAIAVLSVLESLANLTYTNLISLGRPLLATALFFIRAGLWCLVVAGLGLWLPETRNVQTILIGWAVGGGLSLLLTLWFWRRMPWGELLGQPIDWAWVRKAAVKSFPIWLGTLGGVGALHVDRFVVSYFLDLEKVGIVTFFGSFTVALLSLVQSGFFAFSYPRLIAYHRNGDSHNLWRETWQTGWHVCLFVLACAVLVGVAVPFLGGRLGKPEIAAESLTLWLMLASIWIRGNADTLHYVLYARHQDREIWLGGLLFLVPALLGNMVFVPWLGLEGVGVSGILASLFLLGWRGFYAWRGP